MSKTRPFLAEHLGSHRGDPNPPPPIGCVWFDSATQRMRIMTDHGPVDFLSPSSPVELAVPHYHKDNAGIFHTCYHKCREIISWKTVALVTLSFPIEHAIWTKVWPFYELASLLGLELGHH
jgi:hypothetical protein